MILRPMQPCLQALLGPHVEKATEHMYILVRLFLTMVLGILLNMKKHKRTATLLLFIYCFRRLDSCVDVESYPFFCFRMWKVIILSHCKKNYLSFTGQKDLFFVFRGKHYIFASIPWIFLFSEVCKEIHFLNNFVSHVFRFLKLRPEFFLDWSIFENNSLFSVLGKITIELLFRIRRLELLMNHHLPLHFSWSVMKNWNQARDISQSN